MNLNDSVISLKKISKNSIIYIVGDFATKGINFLLIPLYTSLLSTSDYGITGVLNSLASFLAIFFSLQLFTAVSINYYKLDQLDRKQLINSVTILTIVISGLFSVLLMVFGRGMFELILKDIPFSPYVIIVIGAAAFSGPTEILKAKLNIQEKSVQYVALVLLQFIVQIGFTLYFLMAMRLGALGVLLALLVSKAITGTLSVFFLLAKTKQMISFVFLRDALIISFPIVLHMLSHWGLNLMDRFVLQSFVSLSDVGIYQLGYQVGTVYQVLIIAVNNAWVPFFFQRIDDNANHAMIQKTSTWLMLFQLFLASCVILFKDEVFALLINAEYQKASSIVPWVVLGFVFVTFYHMWVNILFSQKETKLIPIATLLAALANFIANMLLIPKFGIYGSAIATTVSYAVLAFVVCIVSLRVMRFEYEYTKWIKIVIAGVVIVVAGSLLKVDNILVSLALKSLLLFAWPFVLWVLNYWDRDDYQLVKNLIAKSIPIIPETDEEK